jgi:glycosyltransferase involved in cell wall biosynthesis
MDKINIVWLCQFSNAQTQSKLPMWHDVPEYASWIPNALKGFENREDVQLHIIAPLAHLKKDSCFIVGNITYSFLSYGIPIVHRAWPWYFPVDAFTNFHNVRRKISKIIHRINPDLINVIGAEGALSSSSALDFKGKYPILITIQGFKSQTKHLGRKTYQRKKVINIEERILREFRYFAGEQDSSVYISSYNPMHHFFRLYFPVNEKLATEIQDQNKIYDCIFYGRLTKTKGIEDFIRVIAELKQSKADVKACIVGQGQINTYVQLSKQLNCYDNIDFVGFLESQKELFIKVKQSRILLIPTHFDRLPSTIREAMYLKVPIVSYKTGGIVYINDDDENVRLVETGDYKAMAQKALSLLTDEGKRAALAEKAFKYALSEFSLEVNTQRLLEAYKDIISTNS